MEIFSTVKIDLACQINTLTGLKRLIHNSETVDTSLKAKLRITLESLLIDLNEEMYELSEELSKSYVPEMKDAYYTKARDFESRKNKLLKRINNQVDTH